MARAWRTGDTRTAGRSARPPCTGWRDGGFAAPVGAPQATERPAIDGTNPRRLSAREVWDGADITRSASKAGSDVCSACAPANLRRAISSNNASRGATTMRVVQCRRGRLRAIEPGRSSAVALTQTVRKDRDGEQQDDCTAGVDHSAVSAFAAAGMPMRDRSSPAAGMNQ